jgi:hypothetical protein
MGDSLPHLLLVVAKSSRDQSHWVEDQYFDDPINEVAPTIGKSHKILGAISILIAGTFFLHTTLAANVSLNNGQPVEFGQGITQTVACSGAGAFYFSSVTVSNIPSTCYGKDFTINAYDNSSNSPLALFNSSIANAVIYNNAGTFQAGAGSAGMLVSGSSGSFTASFTSPVALSSTVFKLSIQSSNHATGALGINWTSRSAAVDNDWWGVAYGNGTFVAVGISGSGNRVMTSPDGVTWTSQTSAADNNWYGVTYGNGLFVAVGFSGTGNRIMTSPDGVTWTTRNSQSDINWSSVIYGNGTFVAVSNTGGTSRVLTSTDGITWTLRNIAAANALNAWYSVTYGNGLFVAVSNNSYNGGVGGTDRVITSPDGINWTARTTPTNNWYSVTYGNGIFVAVAQTGTGNRVMTSPDGINWTSQTSAADSNWNSVTYGEGLFIAVANAGAGSRVMTSPDGINWTARSAAAANSWMAVTYGNGKFVAVSNTGSGNRVMSSTP